MLVRKHSRVFEQLPRDDDFDFFFAGERPRYEEGIGDERQHRNQPRVANDRPIDPEPVAGAGVPRLGLLPGDKVSPPHKFSKFHKYNTTPTLHPPLLPSPFSYSHWLLVSLLKTNSSAHLVPPRVAW